MIKHGDYSFKIGKNIILATIIGAFNIEGATSFCTEFRNHITTMPKEYYVLVDLLEFEGAIKEAYKVGDLFATLYVDHEPPLKRLIVVRDGFTKSIAQSEAKNVFHSESLIFDKKQDALDWLDHNVPIDS